MMNASLEREFKKSRRNVLLTFLAAAFILIYLTNTSFAADLPDLAMTSVSGPASSNTERQITVTNTVTNQGLGYGNGFSVGIYLSTDPVITTSDIYLGGRYVSGLGAGATSTADTTVLIPGNVGSGTYYIGVIADFNSVVAESDETNNTLAGNQIAVTHVYPDFAMTSVSGPASSNTERQITVTNTVTNQGLGYGNGFNVGIYLSTDPVITTSDIYLGGRYVSGLGAGAASTADTTVPIPGNVGSGTYYIGVIADFNGVVAESDETNNTLAGNQMYIGTDITPPSGTISINNGAVATNNTTVTLTLSATDTQSGVSQMQFSNDNSAWSTAEPYATSKSWTIPAGDSSKTVYVKYKDLVGNWSSAIPASITLDTVSPVVTISSPVSGMSNTNRPILQYTVSEAATTTVQVDGATVLKVSGDTLDLLSEGTHTVDVAATDSAGNTGYGAVTFIVATTPPDTTPPVVTISSPVSGLTYANPLTLAFTINEGAAVVKVDGVTVPKVSGNTLDLLSGGPHTVRVEATDSAGNTGFAEVGFTISTAAIATTLSSSPSSPDGASGWFKTTPAITLTSNITGTTYFKWGEYASGNYAASRQPQEWISGGTPLHIQGDEVGAWYALPFSFVFYGVNYTHVYLSSNGLMSFTTEEAIYNDGTGLSSRVAIAPLWDDLQTDTRPGDDIYVFQPDADSIGFRWQAVTYVSEVDTNFEVILYRDGRIRFNYGAQNGDLYGAIGISKGDGMDYNIAYDGNITTTNNMDSIVFAPVVTQNAWNAYTGSFAAPSGENTLYYYSVDNAGNIEATQSQTFKVGATLTTFLTTDPPSPDAAGWFKTVPAITLTSSEPATTYYLWNSPFYSGSYQFSRQSYEWISGGTALNISGEDNGSWHTLPFSFPFYGTNYRQVYLSTNGLLSFVSQDVSWINSGNALAQKVAIAPLWDDLGWSGEIYEFQPDANSIGFRWEPKFFYYNLIYLVNFEVILYRDGRIRFNYGYQDAEHSLTPTIGISGGLGSTNYVIYDRNLSSINNMDSIVFAPAVNWHVYSGPFAAREGTNTIYYYSVDSAGNTEAIKERLLKVDAGPPRVVLNSPSAGVIKSSTPILEYTVSEDDVTVTVTVDGVVVSATSGLELDALPDGSHTVRVEAVDAANNSGYDEVTFYVDTFVTGSDDTNIYCQGTGTYLVGPSSFTNGITIPPAGGNAVMISSPVNYQSINGAKAIIKGAMDTTIPVNSVNVLVANSAGSATYPAQVNGIYFAAQVPVAAGDNIITVTATDQNNAQHQASVTVSGTGQASRVTLQASPGSGSPVPKQSGPATLDVSLSATPAITTPIAGYAWDFDGSGSDALTCYSHSNVNASYEQKGLYLTKVTVTDTAGNSYSDTVIVNVIDTNDLNNTIMPVWNGMKTALLGEKIEEALGYFAEPSKDRFRQVFAAVGSININAIFTSIVELRFKTIYGPVAEYWVLRQEPQGIFAYPVTFVQDENGNWKLMGF